MFTAPIGFLNGTLSEVLSLTAPRRWSAGDQIKRYDLGTGLKFDGGLYVHENPDSDLYSCGGRF